MTLKAKKHITRKNTYTIKKCPKHQILNPNPKPLIIYPKPKKP